MFTRSFLFALSSALLFCTCAIAVEQMQLPPEKPWRPYPDLPDLLYYEDFEGAHTGFSQGTLSAENANKPSKHSYKCILADWGKNEKAVWIRTRLAETPLKIPGRMNPKDISIQFMINSDSVGVVTLKMFHSMGDYEEHKSIRGNGQWEAVQFKLGDLRNKNSRAETSQIITDMEIVFRPNSRTKIPVTYIDDIVMTSEQTPQAIFPKIQAAAQKTAALTRTPQENGFAFSPQSLTLLQSAMCKIHGKRRKQHTILTVGSRTNDGPALAAALNAVAKQAGLKEFIFVAAAGPDGVPYGGLDDIRMLLASSIYKSDAEMAIIMLSAADALSQGRQSTSVGILVDRTLAMGCVPIPCIPDIPVKENEKNSFVNTVQNICNEKGVPWVDDGFALHSAKALADKDNELPAEGINAVAKVAIHAVHLVADGICTR